MTSLTSWALQVEFTAGNWTDISADARTATDIQLRRGIRGNMPLDRVASTGTLAFALDNSQGNSASTLGYYSPDNASHRTNWEIGKRARWKLTYGGVNYYKFLGKIDSVQPTAGIRRDRDVQVTAVDYMDELANHKIGLIPPQNDKRGDQLMTALIANMPNAPANTSYGTGHEIYTYGMHKEKDQGTTGMSVAQKIAQTGMDDIYITGNTTDGETLVYHPRHSRILNVTPVASFSDSMVDLTVSRKRQNFYNNIKVTYHPVQRDIEPAILYSIQSEISLGPGESTTFMANYTDPISPGRRVSSDQMIAPVAVMDYNMSAHSGGKGKTLNSYLTVQTYDSSDVAGTFGANSTKVKLTNTHTTKGGFVTRFNLRGYGLYEYDPVTLSYLNTSSQTTYGDLPLVYDIIYGQNGNVAADFMYFFSNYYTVPITSIDSLEFYANISDTFMTAALACDVGSRITVAETVTGLSTDYFVQGYGLSMQAGGIIKCTLGPLARTSIGGPYGQIGNATYGKVGDTLKIGY